MYIIVQQTGPKCLLLMELEVQASLGRDLTAHDLQQASALTLTLRGRSALPPDNPRQRAFFPGP